MLPAVVVPVVYFGRATCTSSTANSPARSSSVILADAYEPAVFCVRSARLRLVQAPGPYTNARRPQALRFEFVHHVLIRVGRAVLQVLLTLTAPATNSAIVRRSRERSSTPRRNAILRSLPVAVEPFLVFVHFHGQPAVGDALADELMRSGCARWGSPPRCRAGRPPCCPARGRPSA